MNLNQELSTHLSHSFKALYGVDIAPEQISLETTKKEFEGNLTFVVFPFIKYVKEKPEVLAQKLGESLLALPHLVSQYQVVKGFLNLTISDLYWVSVLQHTDTHSEEVLRSTLGTGKKVMVEYSSPNTNKPLHLGHIRNNLLGFSISEILKQCNYEVVKVNLINDRGIHICKSMLAWQKYGHGETPQQSGLKGDHLVGKYYVLFDQKYREQVQVLKDQNHPDPENQAPLMAEARQMLLKWEAKDPEVQQLWKQMNGWVLDGFNQTYKKMGVDFDHTYYESHTYLLGKEMVDEGIEKGIFYTEEDSSVWIDLTEEKLDKKLLLRSDGTSVYITQDLGTAELKYEDFGCTQSIYVVGNEQDYHFKVLFSILKKLQKPYAEGLHHVSYGMVDLPTGKMKSREGTVVDADDLIETMQSQALSISEELGKTEGMTEQEKQSLYAMVGLGALKFYILKVDPARRMLFNQEESIDFFGDTGPFIQYTHARICSLLRQYPTSNEPITEVPTQLDPTESELIFTLYQYKDELEKAAIQYNPAIMAQYILKLTKTFNRLYKALPFLKEPDPVRKHSRFKLALLTGRTLKTGMKLLGIDVPESM